MLTYTGLCSDGSYITVEAENEDDARRLVMVRRWGTRPDDVTPQAPFYRGAGLTMYKGVKTPYQT